MRQIGDSAPPATITSASPSAISRAGIADRMRAGRAGRHHRMVRSLQAVLDRDIAGSEIDQAAGNEERRHLARAALLQEDRGVGDAGQAADAGADQGAGGACAPLRSSGCQSASSSAWLRRAHREDDEVVDLALVLRLHPLVGIEGAVRAVAARDHAGDLAGRSETSNVSIFRAPLSPRGCASRSASTPQPSGVTMPSPVTTTRLMSKTPAPTYQRPHKQETGGPLRPRPVRLRAAPREGVSFSRSFRETSSRRRRSGSSRRRRRESRNRILLRTPSRARRCRDCRRRGRR